MMARCRHAAVAIWLIVPACLLASAQAGPTYYIAADEVQWTYNTNGDACKDPALSAISPLVHPPDTTDGGTFTKTVYREYTDATFQTLKPRPAKDVHLGHYGPLLTLEAGTTFTVVLKNNLPSISANFEPMGGAVWSTGNSFINPVAPGTTAAANFIAPDLPASSQNSRLFLYHSSVDPTGTDNSGLVGPIIVTARGYANRDGTTKGINRDIVTLYQVIQEDQSAYAAVNVGPLATGNPTKMTINGHMYCNSRNLDVVQGEKVRWHVGSIGATATVHNFHWHGNTLLHDGHRVDHVNIMGSNTATLDLVPDTLGTWLFHCHVNAHMTGGMQTVYRVLPAAVPPPAPQLSSVVRKYFIAADEVEWDYAPSGGEVCTGTVQPFGPDSSVFLGDADPLGKRVGSVAWKGQYKQYEDDTFAKEIPRAPQDAYMGLLGPVIRADVGDTIVVVFKNRLRYTVNVHPHGVIYGKDAEGAPYMDGTNTHGDDLVAPGATYTYTWQVAERSGPGPKDPSSIMWLYHSHADEAADTNTGLVGAIVINRKGAASFKAPTPLSPGAGLPSDVDQEAFMWFTVMDEYDSNYWWDNVQRLGVNPDGTPNPSGQVLYDAKDGPLTAALTADEGFREASVKHMINGYMYCNMPKPSFTTNKRTRFHVIVMGTEVDVHAPTIGGGTFLTFGKHGSSMAQLGGTMQTADVVFTDPGTNFDIACRVYDHITAGMHALYDVVPGPAPAAISGGKLRKYFIQAEKKLWNFAPNGYVKGCTTTDQSAVAAPFVKPSKTTIGPKRAKAQFTQYKDGTFTAPKPQPAYRGLMGPVIAAEVGDTIEVTLKNTLVWPINFAPDGGLVALHDKTKGASVPPGGVFTYRYVVPAQAGPLAGDLSTTALMYVSDVDLVANTEAGLMGNVIITAPGMLRTDGVTPQDVDLLLTFHLQAFNEELSPYFQEQLASLADPTVMDPSSNSLASINGFMYCNMPPPVIPLGSKVRVIFSAFGSEEGVFSPRIVGQTLSVADGALQTQQLLAAIAVSSDMRAISAGTWAVVNDVHELQDSGMIAKVVVNPGLGRKLG